MRRAAAAASAALVAIALATGVQVAAGASTDTHFRIRVPKSDGYSLTYTAYRHGKHSGAWFDLARPGQTASYGVVSPPPSRRQVRAEFGRFGRVSLSFDQVGPTRRHHVAHCRGTVVVRRGVFAGRLRFRGEHGYAVADERELPGRVVTDRITKCFAQTVAGVQRANRTRQPSGPVILGACHGLWETFVANRDGRHSRVWLAANTYDYEDEVAIFRWAYDAVAPAAFRVAKSLAARLSPRGLFHGSARLAGQRLRGDLAVDLPGAPDTPLTPWKAAIARGDDVRFPCGGWVGAAHPRLGGLFRPSLLDGSDRSDGPWGVPRPTSPAP